MLGLLSAPIESAPAQTANAVEYYYAAWDHYFVTASPAEISLLDGGAFNGNWKRTGESFAVWAQSGAGALETCRFFSTSFAPRSSHFYTPDPAECAKVRVNPDWQFESIAFYLKPADASGDCTAGAQPLFRLYNDGMGGAPNHRYTTRSSTVEAMRARGWKAEGTGVSQTFACVPADIVARGTAEGFWTGVTNLGQGVRAIVLDDGNFYLFYTEPATTNESGTVQGVGRSAAGTFDSGDARDYLFKSPTQLGGLEIDVGVTGTYVAGKSLTWTISEPSRVRSLTAAYDPTYARPASLAAIAGTYNGRSSFISGWSEGALVIAPNGTISGYSSFCTFNGSLVPRAAVNVFDLTIVGNGNCIYGNGEVLHGIAFLDWVDGRLRAFAPFKDRLQAWNFSETRQ